MSQTKPAAKITAESIYALFQQGRFADGVTLASAADPAMDEEVWILAGMCAMSCGQREQAVLFFRRALMIKPDFPPALTNLGIVLQELQNHAEAEDCYRRAICFQPDVYYPLLNLAKLLTILKRYPEAEVYYRQVISSQPVLLEAIYNLALVLKEQGYYAEAEVYYRQALELKPDDPHLLNDLGELLMTLKRWDAAETHFRQALAYAPNLLGVQYNLGYLLLSVGRWAEGLPGYELRYHPDLTVSDPNTLRLKFPLWQGQNLLGKTIVVTAEQGYGDQIQFCRYCSELKRLGAAKVTLVCNAPLKTLFRSLADIDVLLCREEAAKLESHDYWVRIVSLPFYCSTSVGTIPAKLPYLQAPTARLEKWSRKLPRTGLRVGLFWKGANANPNDHNRSMASLRLLAPLWQVPGVVFISLQKGAGEEEAATSANDQPILDLAADIHDFADTAAIISQLDLVISVCTSVAHLAGALNKPCWVILPAVKPCWRWLQVRSDSPWYPGVVRLFRREIDENWDVVVNRISADLAELARQSETLVEVNRGMAKGQGLATKIKGFFGRK